MIYWCEKRKQTSRAIPLGLLASIDAPILGKIAKPILGKIFGRGRRLNTEEDEDDEKKNSAKEKNNPKSCYVN